MNTDDDDDDDDDDDEDEYENYYKKCSAKSCNVYYTFAASTCPIICN
jgi:hypothetical protein